MAQKYRCEEFFLYREEGGGVCYSYPYEVGDGVRIEEVGPQPCGFGKVAYPRPFVFCCIAAAILCYAQLPRSTKRRKQAPYYPLSYTSSLCSYV